MLSNPLNCSRRAPGYFTLIGDKAPHAARDSSEVARSLNRRCYPHAGNGEDSWCLSSSLFLSVGFSIQDKAMDVAQSAPQRITYHLLVPLTGTPSKAYAYSPMDHAALYPSMWYCLALKYSGLFSTLPVRSYQELYTQYLRSKSRCVITIPRAHVYPRIRRLLHYYLIR